MRGHRAPVRPHQGSRLAQSLSEQGEAGRRQSRTTALFDGDSKEVEVTIAAGASKVVRSGFSRRIRGWLLLSLRCADAAATDVHPFETTREGDTLTLKSNCSAEITCTLLLF